MEGRRKRRKKGRFYGEKAEEEEEEGGYFTERRKGGYFGASVSPSISSFSFSSCHQAALSGSNFLSPSLGEDGDSWGSRKQRLGGGKLRPNHHPSVCPAAEGARAHHMLPAPGSGGQSHSGREENSTGQFGSKAGPGVSKERPQSSRAPGKIGQSWEFYTQLCPRGHPASPEGFVFPGIEEFHPLERRAGRRDRRCSKPSAAMGHLALPWHVGP